MSDLAPAPATPAAQPSGIGGWLLLPALALIITPIRMTYDFVQTFSYAFKPSVWMALLSGQSPYYNPTLAAVIGWEIIANISLFALTIWLIFLFFKKRRLAPTVFILWIIVSAALQLADLILTALLLPEADQSHSATIKELTKAAIGAAIWIPYFRISVRVKNTFVNAPPKPDF